MTTDTEALRAKFEKLLSDSGRACLYEGDGQYAYPHDFAWICFQAGHAAAAADTAAAVAKERERASVLYDMLLNRPALNAGLESEYAAWTSKCYQVTGAYKDAIRAGAKEPSDG